MVMEVLISLYNLNVPSYSAHLSSGEAGGCCPQMACAKLGGAEQCHWNHQSSRESSNVAYWLPTPGSGGCAYREFECKARDVAPELPAETQIKFAT